MKCRQCQESLSPEDRHCPACGQPAPEIRLPAVRPEVYPATPAQALPLYVALGSLGVGMTAAALRSPAGRLLLQAAARALTELLRRGTGRGTGRAPEPLDEPPMPEAVLYRRVRIWRR